MEFSKWGAWAELRGLRSLGPLWECVLFYVYVHFSIKRVLNIHYILTVINQNNVRSLHWEKELQTSIIHFKEAWKNWPKFKFCVTKKKIVQKLSKQNSKMPWWDNLGTILILMDDQIPRIVPENLKCIFRLKGKNQRVKKIKYLFSKLCAPRTEVGTVHALMYKDLKCHLSAPLFLL